MPSSKNPFTAVNVPGKIIELAFAKAGIVCNLRDGQYSEKGKTDAEKNRRNVLRVLYDTWFFYEKMEVFFKTIQSGTRLILVCQGFGKEIFSFITDVEEIYWADGHYPRIDFEKRPRIVQKVFGHSNLWGGFILAAAKVGRVKKQAALGYELLFEIAKRPGGIKP